MKTYREVKIPHKKENMLLSIGKPTTSNELEGMYNLRYKVYSKNGYIDPAKYPNNKETDKYDKDNKTAYYIAKINGQLVGTVRAIFDDPLPIQKAFQFSEPELMSSVPHKNRCEIGRLIITPYKGKKGVHPPRGIVLIFLLDAIIEDSIDRNITGGYAFIKKSLKRKMKKRGMPFYIIDDYEKTVDKSYVLYNYFTQEDDPVIPIYFFLEDFHEYISKFTHNRWLFKRKTDKKTRMRSWLYKLIKKFL